MPLLFETKSHKLAGINVLVACDAETQVWHLLTAMGQHLILPGTEGSKPCTDEAAHATRFMHT